MILMCPNTALFLNIQYISKGSSSTKNDISQIKRDKEESLIADAF